MFSRFLILFQTLKYFVGCYGLFCRCISNLGGIPYGNTTKTRRNEKEEKIETRKIQFATDNKVVRKYVLACVSGFIIKKI